MDNKNSNKALENYNELMLGSSPRSTNFNVHISEQKALPSANIKLLPPAKKDKLLVLDEFHIFLKTFEN